MVNNLDNYPVVYFNWLINTGSAIQNLHQSISSSLKSEEIDIKEEVSKIYSQLYFCLQNLSEKEITVDLGLVKPIIFECKLVDNSDGTYTYVIMCNLYKLQELHLYLYPNTTPCPRYIAFMKILEEFI